jgi:hypothetical protein
VSGAYYLLRDVSRLLAVVQAAPAKDRCHGTFWTVASMVDNIQSQANEMLTRHGY